MILNGLIFYKGKYHFFFQWNPYSGFWDFMHWGHAVSEDLLHWEYLPLALAPSEEYDDYRKGGCFSGSAIVHEGKLFLMYTGVTNRGSGNIQTQCIAYSEDGIHFEKYEGNPVILPPEGVDGQHFRDPKIWKHKDSYYMVCGASCNNRAQALLYRTEDMLHWTYVNVLAESRGEWGYMWECPDFYPLEDKYVLMCSPMGAGDRKAVYFVGDFDYDTGRFDWDLSGEIDWGMDFYAPQSFEAPDGRRLIAAWANEWECMPFWKDWGPTYREGWCGFFNLLREVRMLPDHTLQFVPVKELQKLREEECCEDRIELGDAEEKELRAGDGISFEMQFAIDSGRDTGRKNRTGPSLRRGQANPVYDRLKAGDLKRGPVPGGRMERGSFKKRAVPEGEERTGYPCFLGSEFRWRFLRISIRIIMQIIFMQETGRTRS